MSDDLIKREDAIKAVHNYWKKRLDTLPTKESQYGEVYADIQEMDKILEHNKTLCNFINAIPSADRPQGEWVDCKELPSTDRNVFIAYGTDNMKSVCIGHYEHDMKLWYEDKNFFAKPIYDAMYWCEIPQFPTRMKGADDE